MKGKSSRNLVVNVLASALLLLPVVGVFGQEVESAADQAVSSGADGSATAAPLSRRDLKRVQKEAETALQARDFETAIARFEQLVEALPAGDTRRADALYSIAITSLFRPAGEGNTARAEEALGELEGSFPKFERQAEVKLLAAGLRAQVAAQQAEASWRQEVTDLRSEVTTRSGEIEACAAELAALQAQGSAASSASQAEVGALRAQVRQLRDSLAETQAELKKKDEALEKVKATLVGG